MNDGPGPARRGTRGDALELRLALAFLAVALAAVALLAGLTAAFAAEDVSNLASQQHTELTSAIAVAAGGAWDRNNSWASADLSPVLDLAERAGAAVQVRDQAGHAVASSPGFAAQPGPPSSAAVMVRGQRIGEAVARFTGSGLSAADRRLRDSLLDAIAGAAGLAALLALVTGLVVARRITRPVARLIAVTRAMTAGDRSARAGPVRAPAELRELAAAFDQMAGTLDRQEQIRRDLVAAVTHELRTPIAVLQAGHEALLDGVAEPTPAELASLRDEVLRLARMVGDLQDLAAADAAALHLARQSCDLADLAAAAAGSLARRFEAAGITVDRQLAAAPVLADPRWLHQVITNLLSNALKFTRSGGRVTIGTRQQGPDAVLEVTDTGPGIPAEELPHVFDRFWRGRQAAQISGSGIGLSVAADLARAHGGRLTAASQLGHGTTMTLTLPGA
ncbi:MAG TPA: ATP-binding protein [Streptosporangiaceae bacterium]|nr:ATP-binding protein [Streptosporangiaceae bacterium]